MVPGFTTLTCPPTPQLGQPHLPLRRPALAKSLGEDAEQVLRGSRGLVDHRPRGRQEQLAQRVEGREADGLVRVGDGGGEGGRGVVGGRGTQMAEGVGGMAAHLGRRAVAQRQRGLARASRTWGRAATGMRNAAQVRVSRM